MPLTDLLKDYSKPQIVDAFFKQHPEAAGLREGRTPDELFNAINTISEEDQPAHEPQGKGIIHAGVNAFENSSTGLAFLDAEKAMGYDVKAPEVYKPVGTGENIASTIAGVGGDVPAMVGGSLVGGTSGAITGTAVGAETGPGALVSAGALGAYGAGAGAFMAPAVIKAASRQYLKYGKIVDYKSIAETAIKEGGIGALTAFVGGKVGLRAIPAEYREAFLKEFHAGNGEAAYKLLDKAGVVKGWVKNVVAPAAEVATFTTAGAAAEGRLPTAEEFAKNAAVIGGMHVAGKIAGKILPDKKAAVAEDGLAPHEPKPATRPVEGAADKRDVFVKKLINGEVTKSDLDGIVKSGVDFEGVPHDELSSVLSSYDDLFNNGTPTPVSEVDSAIAKSKASVGDFDKELANLNDYHPDVPQPVEPQPVIPRSNEKPGVKNNPSPPDTSLSNKLDLLDQENIVNKTDTPRIILKKPTPGQSPRDNAPKQVALAKEYKTERGANLAFKIFSKSGKIDGKTMGVFPGKNGFVIRTKTENDFNKEEEQAKQDKINRVKTAYLSGNKLDTIPQDALAQMEKEASDEVYASNPDYELIKELHKRPIRLASIKADFSQETINHIRSKFKGILTKDGKQNLDEVAGENGFSGDRDLINHLLDIPQPTKDIDRVVKQKADQYLEEEATGDKVSGLDKKGFDIKHGGQDVVAASLEKGDKISTTGKDAIALDLPEDIYTVKGEKNGKVILQDGVKKEVDIFDQINIDGIKKTDSKEGGGGNVIREPKRDYTGKSNSKQMSLFDFTGKEEKGSKIYQKVEHVKIGDLRHNVKKIDLSHPLKDVAEIASDIADLSKENNIIVVADKNGKPLSAIQHSVGLRASSLIDTGEIMGAVGAIKGADTFWLVHQHPSGRSELSAADNSASAAMLNSADGTGLKYGGIMAITHNGEATLHDPAHISPTSGTFDRTNERTEATKTTTRKTVSRDATDTLKSSAESKKFLKGKKDGVMLTNNNGEVVAYVEMSPAEMKKLRTGDISTGAGKIYKAIDQGNQTAMIVKTGGEDGVVNTNMARFANANGLKLLDIIADGRSLADDGEIKSLADKNNGIATKFYSKSKETRASEQSIKEPKSQAQELQKKAESILTKRGMKNLGIRIVQSDESNNGIKIRSKDGVTVQGYYDPKTKKITIIADNVSKDELKGVIVHEVVHREVDENGWEGVFGNRSKKILNAVRFSLKSGSKTWKIAHEKAIASLKDTYGKELKDMPAGLDTEETITHFLADKANAKTTLFQRIKSAINAFLFKHGIKTKVTDDIIHTLAEQSIMRKAKGGLGLTANVNEFAVKAGVKFSKAVKSIKENQNFVKWFGDSKVVDENGEPLVVYHGTNANAKIEEGFSFDPAKIGEHGREEGAGFYFTNDKDTASGYAGSNGAVIKAFLSLQKPMKYDRDGFTDTELKKIISVLSKIEAEKAGMPVEDGFLSNYGDISYSGFDKVVNEAVSSFKGDNALEQMGGLVGSGVDPLLVNEALYTVTGIDGVESRGFSNEGSSNSMIYTAFFPSQIKSIYNKGAFDPNNPDIRFAKTTDKSPEQRIVDMIKNQAEEATTKVQKLKFTPKRSEELLQIYTKAKEIIGDGQKPATLKMLALNKLLKSVPLDVRGRITGKLISINKKYSRTQNAYYDKAIEAVADAVDKKLVSNAVTQMKDMLKKAAGKRSNAVLKGGVGGDVHGVVVKAREYINMSQKKQAEFLENMDIDKMESDEVRAAALVLGLKTRSIEDVIASHKALKAFIQGGKDEWAQREKAHKEIVNGLANTLISEVSGKNDYTPPTSAEKYIKGIEDEKAKNKVLNSVNNFSNLMQSWDWLIDKLVKLSGKASLKSDAVKALGGTVYDAKMKESLGSKQDLDGIAKKAKEIFHTEDIDSMFIRNSMVDKKVDIKTSDGQKIPLSQATAYPLWQIWQSPELRERMINANKIDDTTMAQIEKFMTPETKRWAEWQMDTYYKDNYDKLNEVYERQFGVNLPQVRKYVPIKSVYDKGEEKDMQLDNSPSTHATVMKNILKARTENKRAIEIRNGDEVLMQHVAMTNHFVAWADPVRLLRGVFSSGTVRSAIRENVRGNNMVPVINDFIDSFATQGIDMMSTIPVVDAIRKNFNTAVIGGNPLITIKQLTSIPAFAAEIPAKDWARLSARFWLNPMKHLKEIADTEYMKSRYREGWDRDVRTQMKSGRKSGDILSGHKSFKTKTMILTKLGDAAAIVVGGWPVYKYYYDKAIKAGSSENDAHVIADRELGMISDRTQQASHIKDLGQIQRSGSAMKLMTMFLTSPISYTRMVQGAARNWKADKKDAAKRMFIAGVILPAMFSAVSNAPGLVSGDKKSKERLAADTLTGVFSGVPIAREVVTMLKSSALHERFGTDINISPAFEGIQKISRPISEITKDDPDKAKALNSSIDAIVSLMGLNYKQGENAVDIWYKLFDKKVDKHNWWRLLGYSKSAVGEKN